MKEQSELECYTKVYVQQLLEHSPSELLIIDVRGKEEYNELHIPVAINIPLANLETHIGELSKTKIIVTACAKGGGRSAQAADILHRHGFENVRFLCGGTLGWYTAL
jgi:rhodanese-related sulfurtransferase